MYVKLNKKRWQLKFVPRMSADGECDAPDVKNKSIKILSSLKGEHRLDTILHELLHACMWSFDEEFIDEIARDISRVLWRLGYRDTQNP